MPQPERKHFALLHGLFWFLALRLESPPSPPPPFPGSQRFVTQSTQPSKWPLNEEGLTNVLLNYRVRSPSACSAYHSHLLPHLRGTFQKVSPSLSAFLAKLNNYRKQICWGRSSLAILQEGSHSFFFFFFFLSFLVDRPTAHGVPGPGIRSEPPLWPTPQLQHRILNSPCQTRDWACILQKAPAEMPLIPLHHSGNSVSVIPASAICLRSLLLTKPQKASTARLSPQARVWCDEEYKGILPRHNWTLSKKIKMGVFGTSNERRKKKNHNFFSIFPDSAQVSLWIFPDHPLLPRAINFSSPLLLLLSVNPTKRLLRLYWTHVFTSLTPLLVSEPLEGKDWILVITMFPEPTRCQHREGV